MFVFQIYFRSPSSIFSTVYRDICSFGLDHNIIKYRDNLFSEAGDGSIASDGILQQSYVTQIRDGGCCIVGFLRLECH